jgi:hypothetical protein
MDQEGSDASMLTRLKNWIQGSRRKRRGAWEAEQGHLTEQERHLVDAQKGAGPTGYMEAQDALGPKGFDETRRR